MNKDQRAKQQKILSLISEAKGYLTGEAKDAEKANVLLDQADALQKELDTELRAEAAEKAVVSEAAAESAEKAAKKSSGFVVMVKKALGKVLSTPEKELITGEDAENGENYLVPEDVRLEICELRKSYVSARELVEVMPTTALSGSVNYESGTPAGLTAFDDGDDITEDTNPAFTRKTFAIHWFGKLIPISNILIGAERAGLLGYLNRWFVKNAILTENSKIFSVLKGGYNSGTPKAVAGWEALKESIVKDLDPSCLLAGVIATNQSGFACLDKEKFADGRPVLENDPQNPTRKLFYGLPVKVYPDAQLTNIDSTHFPIIYGDIKAGALMAEYQGLQFATSDHFLFGKNQRCLRVIEGFDVISTDTGAYIYGSLTATPVPDPDET